MNKFCLYAIFAGFLLAGDCFAAASDVDRLSRELAAASTVATFDTVLKKIDAILPRAKSDALEARLRALKAQAEAGLHIAQLPAPAGPMVAPHGGGHVGGHALPPRPTAIDEHSDDAAVKAMATWMTLDEQSRAAGHFDYKARLKHNRAVCLRQREGAIAVAARHGLVVPTPPRDAVAATADLNSVAGFDHTAIPVVVAPFDGGWTNDDNPMADINAVAAILKGEADFPKRQRFAAFTAAELDALVKNAFYLKMTAKITAGNAPTKGTLKKELAQMRAAVHQAYVQAQRSKAAATLEENARALKNKKDAYKRDHRAEQGRHITTIAQRDLALAEIAAQKLILDGNPVAATPLAASVAAVKQPLDRAVLAAGLVGGTMAADANALTVELDRVRALGNIDGRGQNIGAWMGLAGGQSISQGVAEALAAAAVPAAAGAAAGGGDAAALADAQREVATLRVALRAANNRIAAALAAIGANLVTEGLNKQQIARAGNDRFRAIKAALQS